MINDNRKSKEKFKQEFKVRLYNFILKLISFIDCLPKNRSCQIISDQLLRSGTSIGANYIEATASSSKKDFINFFHHSLKSANESLFWLALLRDTHKSETTETECLINELQELARILASSLLTLKGKK